MAAKQLTETNC